MGVDNAVPEIPHERACGDEPPHNQWRLKTGENNRRKEEIGAPRRAAINRMHSRQRIQEEAASTGLNHARGSAN